LAVGVATEVAFFWSVSLETGAKVTAHIEGMTRKIGGDTAVAPIFAGLPVDSYGFYLHSVVRVSVSFPTATLTTSTQEACMLDPRPAKLRSQRDINLWRIPLSLSLAATALFGITQIPDILDAYGVIHIPWWMTMGSIDDARAILSAMMGAVATVLALIFSVALLVLSMIATLFGFRLLYRSSRTG
jgi:hypothetical protein